MKRRYLPKGSEKNRLGISLRVAGCILLGLLATAIFIMAFKGDGQLDIGKSITDALSNPETLLACQLPVVRGVKVNWAAATEIPQDKDVEGIEIEDADVDDGVSSDIIMELINVQEHENIELTGDKPRVLIYHTHSTEAYTQTSQYKYTQTTDWRTNDKNCNVVRVGTELAKLLKETYGISVIHDTTNYEPPKLGTSYERSLKGMQEYKAKYPTLTLFIDLHRDAYSTSSSAPVQDYVEINGEHVAKMMFVVGTGEGKTGQGFAVKPDFKSNYQLALRITNELNKINTKLARPIRVKTGRYNQHVSNQCLLVEVGHNKNTLEEVLAAVKYLAAAIAKAAGKN